MEDYLKYHCPSEVAEFWKHYMKDLGLNMYEWNPDIQANIDQQHWIAQWEKENSQKVKIDATQTFGSKGYQCKKCLQYNVKVETNQTRSLDERSIQYFFCLNSSCKYTWRH